MLYNDDTRLIDLTVGELKDLFSQLMPQPVKKEPIDLVYGRAGLCELLGYSQSTVQRLINSGKLKKATFKTGRKVAYDRAMVLEALRC